MRKASIYINLFIIIFLLGSFATARSDEAEQDLEDLSHLNPNSSNTLAFRTLMMESLMRFYIVKGWNLNSAAPGPSSYESLIETGTLPLIFTNPYTGEDAVNTSDYSPGDFYLSFPTDSDAITHFWLHSGDRDLEYDPTTDGPGELRQLEYNSRALTDGRTIFIEREIDPNEYMASNTQAEREELGIPSGDDARTRMFLIYHALWFIMIECDSWIEDVPDSLDGFISLVGRKNPTAWINPYTGEPMEEVEWVNVPNYHVTGNPTDIFGRFYSNQQGIEPGPDFDYANLAGNYAFIKTRQSIGDYDFDMRFAQFYFYLPDGTVAAYLALQ